MWTFRPFCLSLLNAGIAGVCQPARPSFLPEENPHFIAVFSSLSSLALSKVWLPVWESPRISFLKKAVLPHVIVTFMRHVD